MHSPLVRVPAPWRAPGGSDRRAWLGLGAIALLALGVRLLVVLSLHPTCEGPDDEACFRSGADAFYYTEQGRLLGDGHLWVNPNGLFEGTPEDELDAGAQHPPLYPAVLGVASVAGFDTQNDHRVVNALLGTVAVSLIGLVAWRVAGRRAGLIAATIAALAPQLWLNDEVGMSESLFAGLVAGVLLAALAFWEEPRWRNALVLGSLIGLATLTRTEAIGLVVLLVIPLLLVRQLANRERLELLGLTLLAVLVLTTPWVAFNLSRFERPTLLTAGTGVTIAAGACDGGFEGEYVGTSNGGCLDPFFAEEEARRAQGLPAGDESEVDARLRQDGLEYLGDHKGDIPRVLLARAARTWNLYRADVDRRTDVFIEQRYEHGVTGAYYLHLALIPAAVVGLLVIRRRGVTIVPFVAMFATATILAMATFGLPRFRISADVAMVVLAAVALDAGARSIAEALRARRNRPPAADPT